MLEYLYLAQWGKSFDFLSAGSPPIYVRLLALNALFVAIFAVRRAVGAEPMGARMTLLAQLAVLGANLLVVYQAEVETYLHNLTAGA